MDVSQAGGVGQTFAVAVERLAQGAARVQGERVIKLIEDAGTNVPPVGQNGQGSHVNTYG